MKVLITGATGLLGKSLVDTADNGIDMAGTYVGDYEIPDSPNIKYFKADIRDDSAVGKIFKDFTPEAVIHASSIGSPDFAEKNRDITWEINVDGTKRVISYCEKHGSKLIFISSNGIYDGDRAPYGEDDAAEPVNFYGQTKLEGEKLSKKAKVPVSILRPILMYGWNHKFERPNIVTSSIQRMMKGEKIFAYDDVYSNPLFSINCAEAIWALIKKGAYEDFNIAGKDTDSIYGLLVKTAEVFGFDKGLVSPVKQGYFNELVKRPKDTSYKTGKMEKILSVKPLGIIEGLSIMKDKRDGQ